MIYTLCFCILWLYLFVELNNNGLLSSNGYFAMIISLLSFFSVYILLSSTNIVALDDLRGEFSMDL